MSSAFSRFKDFQLRVRNVLVNPDLRSPHRSICRYQEPVPPLETHQRHEQINPA
ncbi:MAG: hypothetical protein V7K14_16725 [Nostoc sp.]|uniref:hypothetical protein n=1 Tax=Nostoc sp. TaxID=1180 RepID=UPI002FF6692C